MTIMALILGLGVGAVAGGVGVLFLLRSELAERRGGRPRSPSSNGALLTAETRLEAADQPLDARVRDAIKAVSAEAYAETNAQLVELAKGRLETTVAPLNESLKQMNLRVQEADRARAQSYGASCPSAERPQRPDDQSRHGAAHPPTSADGGRDPAEARRELAGMLPYCDFAEQVTTTTEDGRLRPDLVVQLPGGKQVVVDAKVPLSAYLDAIEAKDDETRAPKLADHARQVRDHIGKLSQKAYWSSSRTVPTT